ncbi:5 3 -nucleotidase protein [Rutstroemia sp. NJR-2017a WRK4]|nr:5 3 -nucleotidase protein [Rutstroemia sp. NJR-2017a WRK4]PQE14849.1 5 3 -nucleotidase protein [Rutstroemia sp. NJR-2017a WRK4]
MATSTLRSVTPPPTLLKTPATPRFGYDDNYEPYSPRKSSRVASRAVRDAVTPPPPSIKPNIRQNLSTPQSAPRTTRKVGFARTQLSTSSPPRSPQTANKRRGPRSVTSMGERQVPGALDDEGTSSAAETLGLPTPQRKNKMEANQRPGTIIRGDGMLPTPGKTPSHPKQTEQLTRGIKAVSRTLFPIHADDSEVAMPKPKKGRKKYNGIGLGSFGMEKEDEPITIFTDSEDRVPEVDEHADNPFFGDSPVQRTQTRRSRRRMVIVPGEEDQSVDELLSRADGTIKNFRGKLTFVKTSDASRDRDESPSRAPRRRAHAVTVTETVETISSGPLTRSSVRRQLFPSARAPAPALVEFPVTEDEEEAITDIEEKSDVEYGSDNEIQQRTPSRKDILLTPSAPRFGPAETPTIKRATRTSKRYDVSSSTDASPQSISRSQDVSPFRSMGATEGTERVTRKRQGEAMARSKDETKRALNDDGPPSNKSSPYVHSLVSTLQAAGHTVSVVLPHTQRSWIGKAHMVGQTVKPTYFRPGTVHQDDGTTHALPSSSPDQEEWILVDGTPASCVQIGLYHYFKDRGPIDLVVSGPNYGRNSTAVFSLSSGTIGGAMEAAVCRRKAIALSYAFFSRNHDPEIIGGASRISVRLIEYLMKNWGEGVDLYTVNVPLVEGVEERKVLWTNLLQNYWGEGSCFEEVEGDVDGADEEEEKIREREAMGAEGEGNKKVGHTHKHFKWAPRFTDVYKSVEEAPPGNDGWAVKEGYSSVTPLKANFMHASVPTSGELKLPSLQALPEISDLTLQTKQDKSPAAAAQPPHFYAFINYDDPYVQPLILSALTQFPSTSYTLLTSPSQLPSPATPYLHISPLETIPFDAILAHPDTSLTNAYTTRRALIRKHYLSRTCHIWRTKHPSSLLATHVPPAEHFELDYAEFLDDALLECWDLRAGFARNEELVTQGRESEREWWILKPGMSERGQGIRLFSSEEELRSIFEGWEEEAGSESEEEGGEEDEEQEGDFMKTNHLRHFVVQPYIDPPLLLPPTTPASPSSPPANTKFHIRTYVLASGALDVYVYKPMLALFAGTPYVSPATLAQSADVDLGPHLTNTCIQNSNSTEEEKEKPQNIVHLLSSLPLPETTLEHIRTQIYALTGEVFEAAAREMGVHFRTVGNAFEVFGLDFLVADEGEGEEKEEGRAKVYLLEVNAFPDFAQTGEGLRGVVDGLWKEVVEKVVGGFFGVERVGEKDGEGEEGLVLVRKVDLGRR